MSDKVLGMAGEELKSMSHEVKGMWTDEVCAYTDPHGGVVIAASPNGEASEFGYKLYFALNDNKAVLQVGEVLPNVNPKDLRFRHIPESVVNAALNAALGVVLLWDSQQKA
jgi:hypothetical protein